MLLTGSLKHQIDEFKDRRARIDAHWSDADQNDLLQFYVKIMTKTLGAERCSIFIHDPATGKVWLKCGTDMEERAIEVDTRDSVVGDVIDSGEAKVVDNLESKPGAHKEVDIKTGFVTHNILCIPILTLDGSRVSGAVEVLNKDGEGGFTEEDRKTLEEMAHFLELAIENIYLNQQAAGIVGKLWSIAQATLITISFLAVLVVVGLIVVWISFYVGGSV